MGRCVGMGGWLPHQAAAVALLANRPRGDGVGSGQGRHLPHHHQEDSSVAALSAQVARWAACVVFASASVYRCLLASA